MARQSFDVHECERGPRFGRIVNTFATLYFAVQYADRQKLANGREHAVIRNGLTCVYTTMDAVKPTQYREAFEHNRHFS